MRRSQSWAALRGKVAAMPWSNHADAGPADRDFFDRLREQRGSAAAIRLWKDFANYLEIVAEIPDDELTRDLDPGEEQDVDMMILLEDARKHLREFNERLEYRSPQEAAEFWETLKLWRTVAGGAERRRVRKENR